MVNPDHIDDQKPTAFAPADAVASPEVREENVRNQLAVMRRIMRRDADLLRALADR